MIIPAAAMQQRTYALMSIMSTLTL